MSASPVTKRKRATRAKFAKVRTGKRHVKCDETKPACKNCIKWAGYCGGYEAIHSHSKSTKTDSSMRKPLIALPSPALDITSSPEELDIAPHDYSWQFQSSGSLSPPASVDSQSSPYTYPGYAPRAVASHSATTPSCTVFDDLFWESTLPQLAQDSAAIRYATLAAHTLIYAKSHDLASLGKVTGRDYYGEALICYGLALSETRKATSQQTDLREAVVCCMFFVIFETFNSDSEAAQAHLKSGQRLLSELGAEDFHLHLRSALQYLAQQACEHDFDGFNGFAGEGRSRVLDSLVF
ncbi:hypothetical protein C2857_006720 [Epichloe festucae Fl1]|uniref:Zn(2)-C6 fungal-type domain-containing protein n=1 Tax=Epichloe festucae (strain Fl1) TaxID=877507 RepID=A0A7S9KLU7_EPIFF|nr:hypothetical protein C2857_006720 [Epichloe festucae Fl1]